VSSAFPFSEKNQERYCAGDCKLDGIVGNAICHGLYKPNDEINDTGTKGPLLPKCLMHSGISRNLF
jgi:hypothetical protein